MRRFLNTTFLIFILSAAIESGCKSEVKANGQNVPDEQEPKEYADWTVNTEFVERGCNGGLDCIQSLDHPKFISMDAVDFVGENDLVIGLNINGEIKCYPHAILDWHEIINDSLSGKNIFVNYCPLTGSGMAWDRTINGKETTFGISGFLFNSNLLPYDRETQSFWSQMKMECVNGELFKQKPTVYPVIETSWKTWKLLYPQSPVLSTETGYSRGYGEYPYGTYKTDMDIYFPTEFEDEKINPKERVFGITDGKHATCYRFNLFEKGIVTIMDTVGGKNVVIAGSKGNNFVVAFENPGGLTFQPLSDIKNGILLDDKGNIYGIFGNCLSDTSVPALKPVNGFIAYWFAWAAFYPELILHQ